MRIVDIFFKNIEGQASDIKGNIHTIGHLMTSTISDQKMPTISGYFEIDGSTIINAKVNYKKLHSFLLNAGSTDDIACIAANNNDIILGGNSAFFSYKGRSSLKAGSFHEETRVDHTHLYGYLGGNETNTLAANTVKLPSYHLARLFIYHGVH